MFLRSWVLIAICLTDLLAVEQAVLFEDRREQAGIDFLHQSGRSNEKFLIETMGGGIGLLDYDADGLLDIFFLNSGGLSIEDDKSVKVDRSSPRYLDKLYRNQGDGTFRDVTETAGVSGAGHVGYGMGVATGDFDNDGFVDLYATHFGPNVLYRNRGDGTFEDVTAKAGVAAGGWSVSAGFLDHDNDGDLDLFVVRYLDWDFSNHIRCGKDIQVYCSPKRFQPVSNRLYRNDGDGTFTDVSEASGVSRVLGKSLGVAFNDYDDDGWTDIAVANDSVAQILFHNQGNGKFSNEALVAGVAYNEDGGSYAGMGIDFNDYNNDGQPDIIITNLAKELYALYENDGGGFFSYRTRQSNLARITNFMSGWGTRFFDSDHDGWKDLFVAQSHVLDNVEQMDPSLSYVQPPLLIRNNEGKFTDVSAGSGHVFEEDLAGRGAAFGDLDNDGDVDIVMSVLDAQPRVLFSNASELAANWIELKIVGTASNRDALGARVHIRMPSGREQWGYVTTAGSYASANDAGVHFGLGDEDMVEWLQVRWPSGAAKTMRNVKSGRILTVTEPEASSP
jgi:hypothetical protein